jgi:hypothetical protein
MGMLLLEVLQVARVAVSVFFYFGEWILPTCLGALLAKGDAINILDSSLFHEKRSTRPAATTK